jgi:hypothetical protein
VNDVILVALIGAAASIIGSIATMRASVKKNAEQANLTIYRIDQLEDKVNKHNEIIERTYALESKSEGCHERFRAIEDKLKYITKG